MNTSLEPFSSSPIFTCILEEIRVVKIGEWLKEEEGELIFLNKEGKVYRNLLKANELKVSEFVESRQKIK
jgi:hypothetical protein